MPARAAVTLTLPSALMPARATPGASWSGRSSRANRIASAAWRRGQVGSRLCRPPERREAPRACVSARARARRPGEQARSWASVSGARSRVYLSKRLKGVEGRGGEEERRRHSSVSLSFLAPRGSPSSHARRVSRALESWWSVVCWWWYEMADSETFCSRGEDARGAAAKERAGVGSQGKADDEQTTDGPIVCIFSTRG
jgi:hypothetical protein